MSSGGWKDIVKNGWHPEKSGTTLKGQVKGLVGRGDKSSSRESRDSHVAAPRSSLRDPSSFGPPPKHTAAYGQPATAATTSPSSSSPSYASTPVQDQWQGSVQAYQSQPAEEEPPAEPKPYRVDTTGLSTAHLPPPPTRRRGTDGQPVQSPPPRSPAPTTATPQPAVTAKPKVGPSLPPRLPPRSGNGTPSPILAVEQAAGQGFLNQGAINRLGTAGISVPGLGIGGGRTPPPPPSAPAARPSPTQTPSTYGQVDELQARFARMSTPTSQTSGDGTTSGGRQQQQQQHPIGQVSSVVGKKKPPPPPIPKKPALSRTGDGDAPPPIPLATRPTFD